MKISKNRLQQIIKEELSRAIHEKVAKSSGGAPKKELTKDDFKLEKPMKTWLAKFLERHGADPKIAGDASVLFWAQWNGHEDENLKRVKAKLIEKITDGNWKIIAAYSNPRSIEKRLSKAVPYDANKGTK